IDEENQIIRMYLHGSHPGTNQRTVSAVSKDGLVFDVLDEIHGYSYFRVFQYGGVYYAMDALGFINRSLHPDRGWERREPALIVPIETEDEFGVRDDVRMRHSAVYVRNDVLYLLYTRKSDAPERIVMATVPMTEDWTHWKAGEPIEVLRPEKDYEGVDHPNAPSKKGGGIGLQQLRDPGIFEEDGKLYLLYSVAGEEGIAIAELEID
ncbi:MAG: glycoside hydrolase family 32 protein, partial [Cyanothece sp. SIO1E1]|nr:glycoside hydrolase family 32 protein [Cyanothece sp. SIO1E1]